VFYKTFGKRQAKKDDPSVQFLKMAGIRMPRCPRQLVEDCEVITISTPGAFRRFRIAVTSTQLRPGVFRHWFECPQCKWRVSKLYRPPGVEAFACRECHHLVYTSSLKPKDKRRTRGIENSEDVIQSDATKNSCLGKNRPHHQGTLQLSETNADGVPRRSAGHLSSPAPTKWIPNHGHPIWKVP
jgi:hypothetical protein